MPRERAVAGPNGTLITPAGVEWDAIRINRFTAFQALKRLKPGSVLVDPTPREPVLYFFVAPGSALAWDVPRTKTLGATASVVLPPPTRQAPPGPYWLIPPGADHVIRLTAKQALRDALTAGCSEAPLDIDSMRATAGVVLAGEADLPRYDDLGHRLSLLRGHLALLVPEAESLALSLPDEHAARILVVAAVENIRVQLGIGPGPGLVSAVQHAKSLARELQTLCDHYVALNGSPVGEPA